MSGLEIMVPNLDKYRYIISGIRKQSRAEQAGIESGDQILTINGISTWKFDLNELYKHLLGKDGKKIKMELLREGKIIKANFRLEKYI